MKGTETIIKMRVRPNTQVVDTNYILNSLLNLSVRISTDLVPAAKQIIAQAARRGDDGLFCSDWEENYKKLDLTQAQYFYVIKILKNAGIIYKSKGRFYIAKVFAQHMAKIASAMNNLLMDLGAL